MKVTPGGKLSVSLAACIGGLWIMLLLAEPDAPHIRQYGDVIIFALYYLSFPIGWLSGMSDGGHGGRPSQLVLFLLLLIPYCFLVGYSIAGVFHLIRRPRLPTSPVASEDELKKLLNEHRKRDS